MESTASPAAVLATTGIAPATDPQAAGSPQARPRIQTILFATDLTPVSARAQDEAIDLAAALGARLVVVNVLDPRDATRDVPSRGTRIDQYRADRERPLIAIVTAARRRNVSAAFLIWTDLPGQGIVAAAESEAADLIIVGTRALDRAGRFLLGSVSDHVVNHSRCPVLVAR